jgi:NAD(P)-dependent dehydrogenase (short-subunit alcohol dehydrogenase family)
VALLALPAITLHSLFGTYSQAKLANVMHVKTLAALLKAQGSRITVNAVHPGCVRTDVTRNMGAVMRFLNR